MNEESKNFFDEILNDYNLGDIYEKTGIDYRIKISPINSQHYDNISTYIDFLNCENNLRSANELSSSSILTVFQIETFNNNEQSLTNNIEYAVYNEDKTKLDLSVCKDDLIIINYQINTSKVNMSKIHYYYNLGINVFNIL